LVGLSVFSLDYNLKNIPMKRLIYLMAVVLMATISAVNVNGQFANSIRGNGVVEKNVRSIKEPIHGVKVSSGIDVYLSQGSTQSVTVEADENLHDVIVTKVENGILNVYTDKNIYSASKKRVHVTIPEIDNLSTSSAGDIVGVTPIKTEDIQLTASSAGDISVEIDANEVGINISSSGNINISGKCDKLFARLNSAGDLNGYELVSKEADIEVTSAGNASIYVEDRLDARASSAGDITYRGDPDYVNAHSSSAGNIRKR